MPIPKKERTLYRDLIRGAAENSWRHKELWVLGFFAALLGNGGAINFIAKGAGDISSAVPFVRGIAYTRSVTAVLASGTPVEKTTIILTILILVAAAAVGIFLAVSSAGGILFSASRVAEKKRVTLKDAFAVGAHRFWPLLLVQIIGRGVLFALFGITAAVFLGSGLISPNLAFVYLVLFIVFAAGALVVSFLSSMASAAIAIDNDSWTDSFRRAWHLLTRHWLVSVEMIVLLFVINLVAAAALIVAILILTIPVTLLFLAAAVLGSPIAFWLVALVAVAALCILVALTGSILGTFEQSAWALLYIRLSERGASAKLERAFLWLRALKRNA